jgi:hypothetical protein
VGHQTIVVTAEDGKGAGEARSLDVEVRSCSDFQALEITLDHLPQPDRFAFVAQPLFVRKECGESDKRCRSAIDPDDELSFTWDFGDGRIETTPHRANEHDYGTREQKEPTSTFVVVVNARSKRHGELAGAVSLRLDNVAFNNRVAAGIVTPTALVGEVKKDGHRVDFALELRNHDAKSVTLEKMKVEMVPCGDEKNISTYDVSPTEILDGDALPPGVTTTHGHLTGTLASDRYCRAMISGEGRATDGVRARIMFGVEIHPPAVGETIDEKSAAQDPAQQAKFDRIRQALTLLGRDPTTGRVTEEEIRALERRGLLK